jgi:hypothetical protein
MNPKLQIVALASMLLLSACGGTPILPFKLEASTGTYRYQLGANTQDSKLGTAFIVKVRNPDGSRPTLDVPIRIAGSSIWNGGLPVDLIYPKFAYWVMVSRVDAVPLVEPFRVFVNSTRATGEVQVQISDPTKQLELATIRSQVADKVDGQQINADWDAVPNAIGYLARLMDGTDGIPVADNQYTLANQASFNVTALNLAHAHFVVVMSSTINTVADDPQLPTQFDVSDSLTELNQTTVAGLQPKATRQAQAKRLRDDTIILVRSGKSF